MGIECAGDASDLLPPPAQRHPAGRASHHDRPAADLVRPVGGRVGRPRRRYAISRCRTRWRARSSPPVWPIASSSSNATSGFDEYCASVQGWTLERGEAETGVPAAVIREIAHTFAKAPRAMICWTLGHHRASHRGRQRAGPHQSRAADGACRPLGIGHQSASGTEQRAGRRRHGRAARSTCPASSTSKTTRCEPSSIAHGA